MTGVVSKLLAQLATLSNKFYQFSDNDTVPLHIPADLSGNAIDLGLPGEVVGSVAHASTDSGKPVKVGGVAYALPSGPANVVEGQRVNLAAGRKGILYVALGSNDSPADGVANTNGGLTVSDGDGNARRLEVFNYAFNGTSWDRMRSAGSNLGLTVENGPYSYSRKTADGQVKATAGFVHTVTVSPLTATPTAGLLTIYDSASETGTAIYSEWIFATTPGHTVTLDVPCATGIYCGFDATLANVAVTVSYR